VICKFCEVEVVGLVSLREHEEACVKSKVSEAKEVLTQPATLNDLFAKFNRKTK
jgi:hypothetical protein